MTVAKRPARLEMVAFDHDAHQDGFARDVAQGLTASPKRLSCRYFYDQRGSLLFEEICELPEYYLTRAEGQILRDRAAEIAALFPEETSLVELGSGSAVKTRLLIEAFLQRQATLRYLPVDISPTILEESSRALLTAYPRLEIVAVAARYEDGLIRMRAQTDRPKLILWLGSNVGNLDREEAAAFLRQMSCAMLPQDRLLVGIDLRKERPVLERAYDDARGVTAQFNLNILARINRELGGHFDLSAFRHRAVYNESLGRVEMYLDSRRSQRVRIDRLDLQVTLTAGEAIHTENAYKYSPAEILALAQAARLQLSHQWLDAHRYFSVNLLARSGVQVFRSGTRGAGDGVHEEPTQTPSPASRVPGRNA